MINLNPYTPLVSIKSTQNRYQVLQTHPSTHSLNPPIHPFLKPTHPPPAPRFSTEFPQFVLGVLNVTCFAVAEACTGGGDDDVFICSCRNKIGAELHIYLEEGTYHKRLFRGPITNDMKT